MTSDFIAVKNKIKEKLEGILTYVYAYEKGLLEGYPCATIYSAEYNPEWITTDYDEDVYVYTIHLYQELSSDHKGAESAENIIDEKITSIVQAFQTDYTLGGLVKKVSISATKGWTDREMIDRAGVITITCKKLAKIT